MFNDPLGSTTEGDTSIEDRNRINYSIRNRY